MIPLKRRKQFWRQYFKLFDKRERHVVTYEIYNARKVILGEGVDKETVSIVKHNLKKIVEVESELSFVEKCLGFNNFEYFEQN